MLPLAPLASVAKTTGATPASSKQARVLTVPHSFAQTLNVGGSH